MYGLEDLLRYKMYRIYWTRRPWLGRWRKKRSRIVVVQGGLVRRFGAVVCAASLAILLALARRLRIILSSRF